RTALLPTPTGPVMTATWIMRCDLATWRGILQVGWAARRTEARGSLARARQASPLRVRRLEEVEARVGDHAAHLPLTQPGFRPMVMAAGQAIWPVSASSRAARIRPRASSVESIDRACRASLALVNQARK